MDKRDKGLINWNEIFVKYQNNLVEDEDGNLCELTYNEPIKINELESYEKAENIRLPTDLKSFLLFSNGMNLYNVEIFSLDRIILMPSSQLLSFHEWGNGDFDCVKFSQPNSKIIDKSIYFMSHNEQDLSLVCPSLQIWVRNVLEEIVRYGTLYHPMDYFNNNIMGLYKSVKLF